MSRYISCLSLATALAVWLAFGLMVAHPGVNAHELWPFLIPGLTLLLHQHVRRRPDPSSAVALSLVASLVCLAALPNFIRCINPGQLTACKSNLKNIGTALELYACDNAGRYPRCASRLMPKYLKTIPTCPTTGTVTYHIRTTSDPDLYTVMCNGGNHYVTPNYPQYIGLTERP